MFPTASCKTLLTIIRAPIFLNELIQSNSFQVIIKHSGHKPSSSVKSFCTYTHHWYGGFSVPSPKRENPHCCSQTLFQHLLNDRTVQGTRVPKITKTETPPSEQPSITEWPQLTRPCSVHPSPSEPPLTQLEMKKLNRSYLQRHEKRMHISKHDLGICNC